MANPLELVSGYMIKKCAESALEDAELIILAIATAPFDLAQQAVSQSMTGDILSDLLASPLGQLGQDYLAQTVSTVVDQATATVNKAIGSTLDDLNNIQQMVFNSIMSALTVQNDLILFFLQRVANSAVKAIQTKRATLLAMQDALQKLYNAMVILNASEPLYDAYLATLRKALIAVAQAKTDLQIVRDTYFVTELFLARRFASAQDNIKSAITLIEPSNSKPPILPFNGPALLSDLITNVGKSLGVPDSQTLAVIMSIPILAKNVLTAADTYFANVAAVNALLTAYMAGLDSLKKVTGGKMKDYTISVMDSALKGLDETRKEMGTVLNGSPDAINRPIQGFRTTPHECMGFATTWLLELKVIDRLLKTVPVQGLVNLNLSNSALAIYQRSIKTIKSKNNRITPQATLHANEGSEVIGDLEGQLLIFLSASQRAILNPRVPKSVLALGRTAMARLQLSYDQDKEIEAALQEFINAKLPNSVGIIGDSIRKMLKAFGLDRAADLLESGNFADFFGSNTKTATYAGAALVGLQALRTCLNFSPPELFDLDLTLKNFFLAFFLRFKRSAGRNISLQLQFNLKKLEGCNGLINAMRGLGSFCGLTDSNGPSQLMSTLGPSLGVGR